MANKGVKSKGKIQKTMFWIVLASKGILNAGVPLSLLKSNGRVGIFVLPSLRYYALKSVLLTFLFGIMHFPTKFGITHFPKKFGITYFQKKIGIAPFPTKQIDITHFPTNLGLRTIRQTYVFALSDIFLIKFCLPLKSRALLWKLIWKYNRIYFHWHQL